MDANPFVPLHEREGEIENSRGESTTLFSGAREGAFPSPRPSRFRTFRLKNDSPRPRRRRRLARRERTTKEKEEKGEGGGFGKFFAEGDRSIVSRVNSTFSNGLTRPLVPAKINSSAASIHYRGLKLEIARNTTGVSVTSRRRFELNRCQSPAGARPAVFPERRRVSKFKIT